ncbi:hypothetical protein ABPG74_012414 [Tetrahymena malaccensis]
MGVIHFNQERYQEALENFGNSIIYCKYELSVYSHQDIELNLNELLQNFKKQFKHFMFNSLNNAEYFDIGDITQFVQNYKYQNKLGNNIQDAEQQFEYLFNRNLNYQASLIFYLKNQNYYMWDAFEDIVIENISISQLFLPPSFKREIASYCNLLVRDFHYQIRQETNKILNILMQYYINIHKTNLDIKLKESYQITNNQMFRSQQNNQFENLVCKGEVQIQKDQSNQQDQIILTCPIKVRKSQRMTNNFQSQLEQSDLNDQSSFNLVKQSSLFSQANKESNKSRSNSIQNKQTKINQNNFSIFQNMRTKQQQQQQQEQQQGSDFSNQFLLQKESNLTNSNNGRNFFNTKSQFQQQFINKAKSFLNESQCEEKLENSESKQNTLQQSQIYRKKINNFINIQQYLIQVQQKLQVAFHQVRKDFKKSKKNIFDFSSDIYFQYCTLQQAQYQLIQKNYQTAAFILIKSLEECRYYLPYLKKIQIDFLSQIVQINNVKSQELQEIKYKYDNLMNNNLNVFIISTCFNYQFKKKICAMFYDFVNQILFKEFDTFGILDFNFEEQLFIQTLGVTSMKTIQSNFSLFSEIFQRFLSNKINQQQKIQAINILMQVIEIEQKCSLVESIKNDQKLNSIQQNEIEKQNSQFQKLTDSKKCNDQGRKPPQQNYKQKLKNEEALNNQHQSCVQNNNLTDESIISIFNEDFPQEAINVFSQNCCETQLYQIENESSNQMKNKNKIKNQQEFTISVNSNQGKEFYQDSEFQFKQPINKSNYFQSFSQKKYLKQNERNKIIYHSQDEIQNIYENFDNECAKMEDVIKNYHSNQTNFLQSQYKNNQSYDSKECFKGEQVFIQGVLSCIKSFAFNLDEKLSSFMAQYKFRQNYSFQSKNNKNSYTYLIYITDQKLNLQNKVLIQKLSRLLIETEIELLVLILSESQSLEEYSTFQDISENGRQVIKYFFSEEKLLQYIYNNREHIKNYYQTMIIEHF